MTDPNETLPRDANLFRTLLDRGMSRSEIARRAGMSRHTVQAMIGTYQPRHREEISLWANRASYEKAIRIAKDVFGLMVGRGITQGQGSAGMLLEEIGEGRIICRWSDDDG